MAAVVAVVAASLTSCTDPLLDVPTTIAPFKQFLDAVNARFDRPDNSDDDIIRLRP